ncbi:MAG: elongation factor G [Polyangiaceae bacterium]
MTLRSIVPSLSALAPLTRRRAFGIVAHVDAGKTTLTERILHATGRIHAVGSVDSGTTTTDSDPREKRRGITIGAAAVSVDHRGHALTLIDTPGHVDFGVEVSRSLRVLDGAVVVLDAVAGVEPQTETVWREADRRGIPRVVFINKIDRAGADFWGAVRSIDDTFGRRGFAVPLVRPSDDGSLVDLVRLERVEASTGSRDARAPLEGEALARARAEREALVDAASAFDDALVEACLDERDPSAEDLVRALRRGTLAGAIVPVLAGSAKAGLGVTTLLDAIVDLLPDPVERRGDASAASPEDAPLLAFAFKRTWDGHGPRTFVRVFEGVLARAASVRLARADKRVRVGRLVRLFADRVEDIDRAGPGEIVAILGTPILTGETITSPSSDVILEPLQSNAPVLSVALEPKTADDRARLSGAIARLTEEDPSLVAAVDPETEQTLLRGQGELHLEITLEKLREDHRVAITPSAPRVAYRETITRPSEAEVKHSKQTGGPGQFAVVKLAIAPTPRGSGVSFRDASEGGSVPRVFVPAVERGARDAASEGVVAGFPIEDVEIVLVGGAFHANDSNDVAFHIAAKLAMRDALARAAPVILEPIMRLEITAPEPRLGAVLGDLAARRGRVLGLGARGTARTVDARAPLAALVGYVTALRSLTQGRASASMTLAGYEPSPR